MLYLLLPKKKKAIRIKQKMYSKHHYNNTKKKLIWNAIAYVLTLIIETVYSVDWSTLVVSPQQEEVLWIFDFVGQQETDSLQRLLPPVHIVAQKQVVAFWREAPILKQPQQVIVLPVDVTCRTRVRSVHRKDQTELHALVFRAITCQGIPTNASQETLYMILFW